jgi:hypothetical protein
LAKRARAYRSGHAGFLEIQCALDSVFVPTSYATSSVATESAWEAHQHYHEDGELAQAHTHACMMYDDILIQMHA